MASHLPVSVRGIMILDYDFVYLDYDFVYLD